MINKQLKQLRLNAGLKQSYLAYKLGVSQTNISEIESGHLNVSIQTLEMYATFFNKESITETILKTLQ
jgi:transcriptional regulator with XRE-family HTH domain